MRKTSVLVVENDPAIRGMLRMMLDLEGYPVRVVDGGAQALLELRRTPEPRVVLVNHLMPDVDGPAVLAAASTTPTLRRHRYVLMSTCATCESRPRLALTHGLLPKPFTVEQLLDVVEDAASDLPAQNGPVAAVLRLRPRLTLTPHGPPVLRVVGIALAASAAIALVAWVPRRAR